MNTLAIAAGLSVLTVAALLVVSVIWLQSYRAVKTPLALGLLAFCLVLLVENLISLYFYFFTMEMLFVDDPTIGVLVVAMRALQFIAVAAFTYVSLD
ncbi:hypothetical protein [Halovenus halobia]|uniref:hypothetical protein n=1 Tax=Halovenus halobia TaxID=3396622 RepID=UPI003F57EE23